MGTWAGATGNFDAAANWSDAVVPTATAEFANTGVASLTFSADTTVGTLQFDAGAPAYTLTASAVTLTLDGGGVVDASANAPTLVAGAGGTIVFSNSASAGDAKLVAGAGGALNFNGNSSGSAAQLSVQDSGFALIAGGAALGTTTVDIAANGSLATSGALTASTSVTNAGQALLAGSLLTPAYVNSGQTFVNDALTMNGSVSNVGAGQFVVIGPLSGVTTFTNSSTSATAVDIAGSMSADSVDNTAGTFTNIGTVTAPKVVNEANGTLVTSGAVNASTSVLNQGTMTASGTIATPTLDNQGFLATGGILTVNGSLLDEASGQMSIDDALTVTGTFTNDGIALFSGSTSLTTPQYTNTGFSFFTGALTADGAILNKGTGEIVVTGSLSGVTTFTNDSTSATAVGIAGSLSAGSVDNAAGTFTNVGMLTAPTVVNEANGTLVTSGAVNASVSVLNQGTMTASGTIATPTLDNQGFLATGGILTVNGSLLDEASGQMSIDDALTVTGAFENDGTALFAGSTTLTTPQYVNTGFSFFTGALTADGAILNKGTGEIVVTGSLSGVTTFTNDSTSATAVGIAGSLSAGSVDNAAGTFTNIGTVTAPKVVNEANGTFVTSGTLTASTGVSNQGTMTASGTITTPTLTNAGNFATGGTLTIDGKLVDKATGTLAVSNDLTVTQGVSNAGIALIAGNVNLTTPTYVNTGATFFDGAVAMSGAVSNKGTGQIVVSGSLSGVTTFTNASTSSTAVGIAALSTLAADSVVNKAGTFTNDGTLTSQTLYNRGGTFVSDGTLTATTSAINAHGATLTASGVITTPTLTNSGHFSTDGALTLNGALVNTKHGDVAVQNLLTLGQPSTDAGAFVIKSGGEIAGASLTVTHGGSLDILGAASSAVIVDKGGEASVGAGGSLAAATIDGGVLELHAGATETGPIAFGAHGGTLIVDGSTLPSVEIDGFAPGAGDKIDLAGVKFGHSSTATLVNTSSQHNVLEITDAKGNVFTLHLDPNADYSGDSFSLSRDASGGGTAIGVTTGGSGHGGCDGPGSPGWLHDGGRYSGGYAGHEEGGHGGGYSGGYFGGDSYNGGHGVGFDLHGRG